MFDPKITEGPWEANISESWTCVSRVGDIVYDPDPEFIPICSPLTICNLHDSEYVCNDNKDDAKAIAAIPELLEVYRGARAVLEAADRGFDNAFGMALVKNLSEKISKLEDMHCN